MSKIEIALIAGIIAIIAGMVAGYFLGKPPVVSAPPGILGTIQSITGIKL